MKEQEYQARLKRDQAILEQAAAAQRLGVRGFAVHTGGIRPNNWISVTDTAYLYPLQYIQEALPLTTPTPDQRGNQIITQTLADMDALMYNIWYRTFLALPKPGDPNAGGFSCAVGTQFTGSFNELEFRLSTGQLIMVWQEVTQVTDQADLPNSGDSPQGTVAYVPIWIDGDGNGVGGTITETMIGNFDPLRVVKI